SSWLRDEQQAYFANGLGLTWNFTSFGFEYLPRAGTIYAPAWASSTFACPFAPENTGLRCSSTCTASRHDTEQHRLGVGTNRFSCKQTICSARVSAPQCMRQSHCVVCRLDTFEGASQCRHAFKHFSYSSGCCFSSACTTSRAQPSPPRPPRTRRRR